MIRLPKISPSKMTFRSLCVATTMLIGCESSDSNNEKTKEELPPNMIQGYICSGYTMDERGTILGICDNPYIRNEKTNQIVGWCGHHR